MIKCFLPLCLLIPLTLSAQYEEGGDQLLGWPAEVIEIDEPEPFFPFSLSGSYVAVSDATFRTPDAKGEELFYKQAEVAFAYTQPCTPYCGFIFGAGYVDTELDWAENPEFREDHFGYVNLSIGGFTKSFPDWLWTGTIGIFLDTEEFDLTEYSLYQGVLWGRYTFNDWSNINVGFILEIGLRKEKIWPILGFELFPCPSWKLVAIYPVDISFEYFITGKLSAAASLRFLRNRHRLSEEEPNTQGIFEYHSWGGEVDLIFRPWGLFSIKGFAGSTFGGDLKITDRKDKNGQHFKFDPSFYAGGSAILSF